MHYKCIHYRTTDEITTKSNGIRPKQAYVAPCGCLAEIRVNFEVSGQTKNKYKIVKCNLNHERINSTTNQTEEAHKISQEDYSKHPSNRRLTDEEENEINSKQEAMPR